MRIMAVGLVLFGLVALLYGGIGYNRKTTILDVGGIKATATEHKTLPIAPVVGGIGFLGGIVLLATRKRPA